MKGSGKTGNFEFVYIKPVFRAIALASDSIWWPSNWVTPDWLRGCGFTTWATPHFSPSGSRAIRKPFPADPEGHYGKVANLGSCQKWLQDERVGEAEEAKQERTPSAFWKVFVPLRTPCSPVLHWHPHLYLLKGCMHQLFGVNEVREMKLMKPSQEQASVPPCVISWLTWMTPCRSCWQMKSPPSLLKVQSRDIVTLVMRFYASIS